MAANRLVADWHGRPDESRFGATKRSYEGPREGYPHLASSWAVSICNETSATLDSWDHLFRRWKRTDPTKWARCRRQLPRRARLKASLHPSLYRIKEGRTLDVTLSPQRDARFDLSSVRHPLIERYGAASGWKFGLAVTERALVFNFRVPEEERECADSVGVDVNMPPADFATTDGEVGSVDLKPITRIQGAMARKRALVQRHVSKDLRHQRTVLRRYRRRERDRVAPLLHRAAHELLEKVGERNVVLEDRTKTQEELLKTTGGRDRRRRLSAWTQARLQRMVEYKACTRALHVNPRGTSSECPRCGGRLAHPGWRRSVCANCQGDWHRNMVAATSILSRGQLVLRGTALSPRALDALLEKARWSVRSAGASVNADEANAAGVF